jgi:hypothetical protein
MVDETSTSDYYDTPVDVKSAQETYKRNLPPTGNYVTNMDFEPSVTKAEFEGETRPIFNVFLRASLTKGGEVIENALRFRFSPEVRPATKFGTTEIIEGKDDSASKRYAELVKAYLDNAGEDGEPLKTVGQLVQFIQSVPLQFATMNGDRGLQVTKISLPTRRSR